MKAAQPGDVLAGRYRLRGVIGQGGMGIVWLAGDELLARDVAIKEAIRPAQFDESDWAVLRERSLREARTAAQLNHPNIVGVYDVFEQDSRPWLVMQLVPFPSLRDVVVNGGPLQPVEAAQVGLRVLAAIQAAHAAGILHRDVKPANILLGPDDQVYLTDFGLAVADSNPGVTMAGVIMGSPAYMAPERARSLAASPATDLWALGATLYAAVEGRDPFERNGTMAVLTAIVADEPDAPELAGPLWPVINGLLQKDPQDRLDASETEHLLRGLCDSRAAATTPGLAEAAGVAGVAGFGAGAAAAAGGEPTAGLAGLGPGSGTPAHGTPAYGTPAYGSPIRGAVGDGTANIGTAGPGEAVAAGAASSPGTGPRGPVRHDEPRLRRPGQSRRRKGAVLLTGAVAGVAAAVGVALAAVTAFGGNGTGRTAVPGLGASHPASSARARTQGRQHGATGSPSSPSARPVSAVSHRPPDHKRTPSPAPDPAASTPGATTSPTPAPTPTAPASSPPASPTPSPAASTPAVQTSGAASSRPAPGGSAPASSTTAEPSSARS